MRYIIHDTTNGGTDNGISRAAILHFTEQVAEELGFIGCFAIIALFAVLIWRGILTAMKAPDTFGSLLAVGITTLI